MKITLYYKVHEDNFEGTVNTYLLHKELEYSNLQKDLNKMADDSDGEMSYTPFCICGDNGIILRFYEK